MSNKQFALSERRNINVFFTDGITEAPKMPIDALSAVYQAVKRFESQPDILELGRPDILNKRTAITGSNPNQVHIFDVTTEFFNGTYYFVYVRTVSNTDVSEGVAVNGFSAGELAPAANGDPCLAELTETFPLTLYHTGAGEFPNVGDFVYTDEALTIPRTVNFAYFNGVEPAGVAVSSETGEVVPYTCR